MEETTVWKGHSSQVLNLKSFLACGLVALFLLGVFVMMVHFNEEIPSWLRWTDLLLLLVPLGFALRDWLRLQSRVYELTTERFLITQGIFSRQTDTLELYRVKDLTVLQPFFLRLLSLGNIILQTSDRTTPIFGIEAVSGPKELSDLVRKQVEACRDRKRVGEIDMNESIRG